MLKKVLAEYSYLPTYDPQLLTKVKTISGYILHPQEKHGSLPNSNGTLTGIIRGFKGKEIHFDLIPQADIPLPPNINTKASERTEG